MAIDDDKLRQARDTFALNENQDTAAMFLSVLREAEENGVIDDEEFHSGLAMVETYLWKGGTVQRCQ